MSNRRRAWPRSQSAWGARRPRSSTVCRSSVRRSQHGTATTPKSGGGGTKVRTTPARAAFGRRPGGIPQPQPPGLAPPPPAHPATRRSRAHPGPGRRRIPPPAETSEQPRRQRLPGGSRRQRWAGWQHTSDTYNLLGDGIGEVGDLGQGAVAGIPQTNSVAPAWTASEAPWTGAPAEDRPEDTEVSQNLTPP